MTAEEARDAAIRAGWHLKPGTDASLTVRAEVVRWGLMSVTLRVGDAEFDVPRDAITSAIAVRPGA